MGTVVAPKPVIQLSFNTSGAYSDKTIAGNIGEGILHKFNWTVDYQRQEMYFEPNSFYAKPDVYNRTGMTIDPDKPGFPIADVVAGSPADVAGIKIGDSIVAINGVTLHDGDDDLIRKYLREPVGHGACGQGAKGDGD